MEKERRASERYAPPEHSILFFGQHHEKMGIIKNISTRGLVYQYFADEDHGERFEGEVNIMISGPEWGILKVECRTICDSPVVSRTQYSWPAALMRRRGLQFKSLSNDAEEMLDRLLAQCKPIDHSPASPVTE